MSAKTDFETGFEKEETEMLVLMKQGCSGAAVYQDMLKPSVDFLASVDVKTGICSKDAGRIEWIIKNDRERKGWGYDFQQFGIYHVKVRKCIPQKLKPCQLEILNNRYMLVEILEEGIKNVWLEELQKYYAQPVTIENELGIFELDREFSWFDGEVDKNGISIFSYMETDEENGNTAETAMRTAEDFFADFEEQDKKYRLFAARQLTGLANDWLEEDDSEDEPDEITKDMFAERIEIREITFCAGGELTLYYSDDDMFGGHSIEIMVNASGEPESANIAG